MYLNTLNVFILIIQFILVTNGQQQLDVRLNGIQYIYQNQKALVKGIVEVYKNSQWGNICNTQMNKENSDIICKQMGYIQSDQNFFGECIQSEFFIEGIQNCFINNAQNHINQCDIQEDLQDVICSNYNCLEVHCESSYQQNGNNVESLYNACQNVICSQNRGYPMQNVLSSQNLLNLSSINTQACLISKDQFSKQDIESCNLLIAEEIKSQFLQDDQVYQNLSQQQQNNIISYYNGLQCSQNCLKESQFYPQNQLEIIKQNFDQFINDINSNQSQDDKKTRNQVDENQGQTEEDSKIPPLLIIISCICLALLLFIYVTYRQSQQKSKDMQYINKNQKEIENNITNIRQYKQKQINLFHSFYMNDEENPNTPNKEKDDLNNKSVQFSQNFLGQGSFYNKDGCNSPMKGNLKKEFKFITPQVSQNGSLQGSPSKQGFSNNRSKFFSDVKKSDCDADTQPPTANENQQQYIDINQIDTMKLSEEQQLNNNKNRNKSNDVEDDDGNNTDRRLIEINNRQNSQHENINSLMLNQNGSKLLNTIPETKDISLNNNKEKRVQSQNSKDSLCLNENLSSRFSNKLQVQKVSLAVYPVIQQNIQEIPEQTSPILSPTLKKLQQEKEVNKENI